MAQKLIPFFREAKRSAPISEARKSASRLLDELENVRNVDYGPVGGYQMRIHEEEYQFLVDTIEAMGL